MTSEKNWIEERKEQLLSWMQTATFHSGEDVEGGATYQLRDPGDTHRGYGYRVHAVYTESAAVYFWPWDNTCWVVPPASYVLGRHQRQYEQFADEYNRWMEKTEFERLYSEVNEST